MGERRQRLPVSARGRSRVFLQALSSERSGSRPAAATAAPLRLPRLSHRARPPAPPRAAAARARPLPVSGGAAAAGAPPPAPCLPGREGPGPAGRGRAGHGRARRRLGRSRHKAEAERGVADAFPPWAIGR